MKRMTVLLHQKYFVVMALTALFAIRVVFSQVVDSERVVFKNSVIPLPPQMWRNTVDSSVDHQNDQMELMFSIGLEPSAVEQLKAKADKGETISAKVLLNEYAAPAEKFESLTKWLNDHDYKITYSSPDRTAIYARSTVKNIEKTLKVEIVRVTYEGLTYNAASDAPSLPKDIGTNVQAIIGLQPFRHAHKNSIRVPPTSEELPVGGAMHSNTASVANAPPYMVSEILHAYDADKIAVDGSGETIAILIDTFPDDSDLKQFWSINKLKVDAQSIEKVNVKNVQLDKPSGEETLDAEWASGIAPGAKIRIYASGTLQFQDLDRALSKILVDLPNQPGLHQLSVSLGLGETYMAQAEINAEDLLFLKLSVAGVNVFVSSGDAGSSPGPTGHDPTGPDQAEFESSDAYVVGVGGTSLNLAPDGGISSESAWRGSGGGVSVFFSRPAWQVCTGVPSGKQRCVPDVCAVADPSTGAYVYFRGGSTGYGGTSLSAPVWAGFCALINQARQASGKHALGYLNPLIYPLVGSKAFRDITTGSNGLYTAGAGYDLVTGVGSPDISKLISAIP